MNDNEIPLDSQDPVDVREAYAQGMRATITMIELGLPEYREHNYEFAENLEALLRVAKKKIEEWAEESLLP